MKTNNPQQTVYVGLSGGVDSSVSAALLLQAGYRVVGVYMKNWTDSFEGVDCPWRDDLADAKAVAARLDIPLKVFDFQRQYKHKVVDYMLAEYQAGRTPNPDIMCNAEIKFKLFLETALEDGADMIATGHYARIEAGKLYIPKDVAKDQTYFLYRVTGAALKKTLFPLAGLTKPEVRALAEKLGLVTAQKADSVGICFVGEVGMKTFLGKYLATEPGDIVLKSSGQVLGRHEGAVFFTIGQRQGLGIGGGVPYYVVGKDMARNLVYVTGNANDLLLQTGQITLENVHWIAHLPAPGRTLHARVRHLGQFYPVTLQSTGGVTTVTALEAIKSASPGQSLVIYDGDNVLGGGIIACT